MHQGAVFPLGGKRLLGHHSGAIHLQVRVGSPEPAQDCCSPCPGAVWQLCCVALDASALLQLIRMRGHSESSESCQRLLLGSGVCIFAQLQQAPNATPGISVPCRSSSNAAQSSGSTVVRLQQTMLLVVGNLVQLNAMLQGLHVAFIRVSAT